MVYTFEQAWLNVQELHYEQERYYYRVGIELNGCNLSMPITKERLEPIIKWDDTFKTPTPEEENDYAIAYSAFVNAIVSFNSFQFKDVRGECILIPKCLKVFKNYFYEYDVDEGTWHRVKGFSHCHPIILELRGKLLGKNINKNN